MAAPAAIGDFAPSVHEECKADCITSGTSDTLRFQCRLCDKMFAQRFANTTSDPAMQHTHKGVSPRSGLKVLKHSNITSSPTWLLSKVVSSTSFHKIGLATPERFSYTQHWYAAHADERLTRDQLKQWHANYQPDHKTRRSKRAHSSADVRTPAVEDSPT